MFCEPCRRERSAGRFCVLCGSPLIDRARGLIEADLSHVRWLLDEVPRWDESLAPGGVRRALVEFYLRQEGLLTASLNPPVKVMTTPSEVPPHPLPAERGEGRGEGPSKPQPKPKPKPTPVKPKPQPTRWHLTWKPFLHESLGWFLGAFLILSGALYLIADAWNGMTSTTRALTVFGLVEAWSLGFFAWAAALSKKPHTRVAAIGLRRIAALIAPLSVLALGPALASPLSWLPLLFGVIGAGFLALRAAEDLDEPARWALTFSVSLTTACLGLAPVLPSVSGWLVLLPTALAAWAFRGGPRATSSRTTATVLAFLLPVALLTARLAVAWPDGSSVWAAALVSLAGLAAASLWLRDDTTRGPVAVVAMSVLGVTFLGSFVVAAPACVLICLLGAWATWKLSAEVTDAHPLRAWWLAGTYVLSFLAWQRVDQLVPSIVWAWWASLKASLGYASAPMPASYGSIYQSLFIAVGAVVAGLWLRRRPTSRHLHVWLRSSALAAGLSGLLAMLSVTADARPALVALPVLFGPMLFVALSSRRVDALASSGLLAVLWAFTLALTVESGWATAGLSLALAVGAHVLPMTRANRASRRWLAGAALISSMVCLLLVRDAPGAIASLAVASIAAALAGRALHRHVFSVALFAGLVVAWRLGSPLVLASAALVAATLLWRFGRKARAAVPVLVVSLVLAPLWQLTSDAPAPMVALLSLIPIAAVGGSGTRLRTLVLLSSAALLHIVLPPLPLVVPTGLTWLVAAATAELLARKTGHLALRGVALSLLALSVAPLHHAFGWTPSWPPLASWLASALFALAGSTHAVLRGRTWLTVLFASLAAATALSLGVLHGVSWALVGVVVLAATPALLAWVTVPLAAVLFALAGLPSASVLLIIAVVAAVLALAEEFDFTWRVFLNRAPIAWVASAVSGAALLAALALGGRSLGTSLAALALPLLWTRATRRGAVAFSGVLFAALAGPWWSAPLFAVVAGRALDFEAVRALLSLPRAKALEAWVSLALMTLVAGGCVLIDPSQATPWALAILLAGVGAPALRVAIAAALSTPDAAARPLVVGALVTLGALARHAPRALRRLLAAGSLKYFEPTSLLLAVAGAALCLVTFSAPMPGSWFIAAFGLGALALAALGVWRRPATGLAAVSLGAWVATLAPALMLPVTLLSAGVILGVPAVFAVGVFLSALDVSGSIQLGLPVLHSAALAIALVAAALAAAMRWRTLAAPVEALWRWLGRESDTSLASALFWAAFALAGLLLAQGAPSSLAVATILLVTPRRREHGPALALAAAGVVTLLAPSVAVPALGLAAVVLAYGSTRFGSMPVSSLWRHAGWLLAVLGLVRAGVDVGSPLVPLAWSLAAATAWLLLGQRASARGWVWAATSIALHVVMAFVGVVLSTGAPKVLIFPWWALGSAALVLLRFVQGGRRSVTVFSAVTLVELLLGVGLLARAQPREAVVSVVVAVVIAFVAWRRVVADDHAPSAWLGQLAVVTGALAARVLGAGALPELTDAWVLLGASAVFGGLAQFFTREGRGAAGRAFRFGALGWPVLGALLVPWDAWGLGASWLLGVSVLGAWLAVQGQRRVGTTVSAVALNVAVVLAALGSGLHALQFVLVPFGLTLLGLARAFRAELSAGAAVQLRAWGMGLVYAAVAWDPLTATSVPAMVLCVSTCLGGVALGALWRIRSYVVLGSGALVTTVLATLVRSGLAEPRLGAVFLSLLGLIVVVVMVVISTRREELRGRMAALQAAIATWTP